MESEQATPLSIKTPQVTTATSSKSSSGSGIAGAFIGGVSGVVIVIVVLILMVVFCCCACVGLGMLSPSSSTYNGPRVVSYPGYTEHGAEPAPSTPGAPTTPATPGTPGNPATPGSSSTPGKFKVGELIALDDMTIQVNAVDLNVTSNNTFFKPDAGNKYIAADVKVTNKSSSSSYISSFSFDAKDAEGFNYDADVFDIKEPALPSKSIANGDSVRGWVTFEVSQKSKSLELVFTPGIFSAKTVVVSLE